MSSKGGLPYYITARCGRTNCPSLWSIASLARIILWIFDNGLLSQTTSEVYRIKCIFIKIIKQHYLINTMKGKVKGTSEEKVDKVYMMIYL